MVVPVMDADWSVELGADDPVLEFPWSSADGALRYLDLRQRPEALMEIPEARTDPVIAMLLREVNGQYSPWQTVKCNVWIDHELSEAEAIYGGRSKLSCYVDLIARDQVTRFSFDRHEAWVRAAARAANSDDNTSCTAEFIVRRCWYHPEGATDPDRMTAGFYVTLYVFGYGQSDAEARLRWTEGVRHVTPIVTRSNP